MTLKLKISPEVERGLAREAELRGIEIPVLAAHLLEKAVAPAVGAETSPSPQRSIPEIRAWLDSLTEFSDHIPALPDETFSRAMIYQNHD